MLNKLILVLAVCLVTSTSYASDFSNKSCKPDVTCSDEIALKQTENIVAEMSKEEKLSAENRFKSLREILIRKMIIAREDCGYCKVDSYDAKNLEDAADRYLKDLKEREKK